MRAFVIREFGTNNVMHIEDVAEPLTGPDTVLIRTKAVGVNPVDWKIVRGYLAAAIPTHFPLIPCWDVAGVVESVGPAVVQFEPGDEVLAYCRQDHVQYGTLADHVGAPLRCVAHKPKSISWVQAAALPLAGLTAHQVIDAAHVTPGDTVLILNAAGGVGSIATQLCVHRGARVIGTASEKNHAYLTQIGAEPVRYGGTMADEVNELAVMGIDAVLDFAGGDALDVAPKLLSPNGRLVSIVDAKKVHEQGGRYVFVKPDSGQLTELAALVAAGTITLNIAKTFTFESARAAFDLSETGHVVGKIAIEL